jgi:ribosomal protein S18 acetylase RimI-like enzyme
MKEIPLKIRRVNAITDPEFAEVVRIYTEAHPESERKNMEWLSAMVELPEYFFLAAMQDHSVAGFAILLCFCHSDACLLEYLAVSHDRRSLGIGKFLFEEFTKLPEISDRYLLAEVDAEKTQLAMRRKNFYRRLGCKEIDGLRYIMPPVSVALPPEMNLMIYRRNLPASIERTLLRKWLASCYVEVYEMPANDARIETMLKALPIELRLI